MAEKPESEENVENQGVKVRDRRHFDAEGRVREEGMEAESPQEAEEPPPEESVREAEPSTPEDLPADFPTLILSLASSAQLGLGLVPHPASGQLEKNLLQAKHAIDLLGVLQDKTRGNLSQEEEKLLQAILYDLRLQYLEVQKGSGSEEK